MSVCRLVTNVWGPLVFCSHQSMRLKGYREPSVPAWSSPTSAGSSGSRLALHEGTTAIPHLPVLGNLCPGVLPFLQRKILPWEHWPGEWAGFLPSSIAFDFCLLFWLVSYSPLHSTSLCLVHLDPSLSGAFSTTIRSLGSGGEPGFVGQRRVPEVQMHERFSSGLYVASPWLKPHVLSSVLSLLLFFQTLTSLSSTVVIFPVLSVFHVWCF